MKDDDSPPLPSSLDDSAVDAIAKEASAHPHSVVRRLAGLPVRGLAGQRIDCELAKRGLIGAVARREVA